MLPIGYSSILNRELSVFQNNSLRSIRCAEAEVFGAAATVHALWFLFCPPEGRWWINLSPEQLLTGLSPQAGSVFPCGSAQILWLTQAVLGSRGKKSPTVTGAYSNEPEEIPIRKGTQV